jgi:DNA repair exonuclease SbcCD ATPase subunit
MPLIDILKNFDKDRADYAEMVALSALGRSVQSECDKLNAEEPEWLAPRLRELRREIHTRQQDRIEKELREHKAHLESLKPATERRKEIEAKIKELEKQLEPE